MDKEFNLVAVVRILIKWRMPIIVVTFLAGVAAALFSFLVMDDYYLSWSTVYPTNQYVTDRSMIFNSENTGGQIDYFGGKGDVNRIITIANSEPVTNYLIDSFKLVQHYKIDTAKRYWKTKVGKMFDKNYEALKTEHDAVKISIFDTDPKVASAIVNAAVNKIDELNKAHIEETKRNLYNLLNTQITEQQNKVNWFVDTLSSLSAHYKIKVSSGAEGTVVVEGNDFRAVQMYKALMSKQENTQKELNNRINIRDQMGVSLNSSASSLFVVESAFPADRKEKPVRSVIILITLLATAFVSVIGVLLIEQWNELKSKL